ncbi:DUF3043 domain-containing protein [Lolliginicoccus suaedae]|uniref:DUF3043 domain-containing protein n=1 Tax=Lolliginicoccus suaedae TaxID=2605429 RepID=UPI0011ECD160|nr:DUF3043 domain-containing protein [Lolliginicoccus suaedae]
MKLSGRGSSGSNPDDPSAQEGPAQEPSAQPSGHTPGKGRPTPKRNEARRGARAPLTPPPMTRAEARARRKALKAEQRKKPKMSKEERKRFNAESRSRANERRARMMAGDEDYLLPRDRGKTRKLARDYVDARRNLAGMFMPLALLVLLTLFMPPDIQAVITLGMMVFLIFMIVEGIVLGRQISNRVRARFPDSDDTGLGIGWYAFVRATQIRRLRVPKPQVRPGDAV